MDDKPLILWHVTAINRATREFSQRDLVLDYDTLAAGELEDILRIVNLPGTANKIGIVKYRKHFKLFEKPEFRNQSVKAFALNGYFEDEHCNPMSTFEMMQAKSGHEDIVVMGDLQSVLRIGPTAIAKPEIWTAERANTLAHFIEVVEYLAQSDWIKKPVTVTEVLNEGRTQIFNDAEGVQAKGAAQRATEVIALSVPDVLSVNSILAFVRQLVKGKYDDLFEDAVKIFLEHLSDGRKRDWISHERDSFSGCLNQKGLLGRKVGLTGGELLRLYFYSFGLLHPPAPEQIAEFREAVKQNGAWLTFAFHSTMQQLIAHAHNAAIIIRQDFEGWLADGHAKPDRVLIADVLGSKAKLRPGHSAQ